jgi:hypothetical protein
MPKNSTESLFTVASNFLTPAAARPAVVSGASGTAADIVPSGILSSIKLGNPLPALKGYWATISDKISKTNITMPDVSGRLATAKDASVTALGNALSAAIPDVIEDAAKAHPAVAGFVAGAAIASTFAYRKEIKNGATAAASSTKAFGDKLVTSAKEAYYGKPKATPAPAAAADEAVTAKAVTVTVNHTPAAAKPAPVAAAPAKSGWGLPSFFSWNAAAPKANAPAAAAVTKPALDAALRATEQAALKDQKDSAKSDGPKRKRGKV